MTHNEKEMVSVRARVYIPAEQYSCGRLRKSYGAQQRQIRRIRANIASVGFSFSGEVANGGWVMSPCRHRLALSETAWNARLKASETPIATII
jgi:hypothetical protein